MLTMLCANRTVGRKTSGRGFERDQAEAVDNVLDSAGRFGSEHLSAARQSVGSSASKSASLKPSSSDTWAGTRRGRPLYMVDSAACTVKPRLTLKVTPISLPRLRHIGDHTV